MGSKRFQTYFGVPIPPFKEDKLGAGSITIRFVLKGRIPSKKNSQQAVAVRKNARKYINDLKRDKKPITFEIAQKAISMVYSKMRDNIEYKEYLEEQRPIVLEQMQVWSGRLKNKGLVFPLHKAALNLRFYFNNRYTTDTVNKQQTVQDLLVDCGVVSGDDYNRINPINSASACYVDELLYSIAFISLSFKINKK